MWRRRRGVPQKLTSFPRWGMQVSAHFAPAGTRWAIPGAYGGDHRHHEELGGRVSITSQEEHHLRIHGCYLPPTGKTPRPRREEAPTGKTPTREETCGVREEGSSSAARYPSSCLDVTSAKKAQTASVTSVETTIMKTSVIFPPTAMLFLPPTSNKSR